MIKLSQIHHVAYRCNDAKETVEFYKDKLNMDFLVAIAEDLVCLRRRHSHFGVGGIDFFDQLTSSRVARHDRGAAAAGAVCAHLFIQPQLLLTFFGIRTVTLETVFRKDWADVLIETHFCRQRLRLVTCKYRQSRPAHADNDQKFPN